MLLVVLLVPDRELTVAAAFEDSRVDNLETELARVADDQVALRGDPGNGEIVESLSAALSEIGRHDMSLRVAGQASTIESPTRWRSLYAVAAAHADRLEILEAADYGHRAMAACEQSPSTCPPHERTRLGLLIDSLDAGVKAIENGADPRRDPQAFRRELFKLHPTTRMRQVHSR